MTKGENARKYLAGFWDIENARYIQVVFLFAIDVTTDFFPLISEPTFRELGVPSTAWCARAVPRSLPILFWF